jgi:hypothetical protein
MTDNSQELEEKILSYLKKNQLGVNKDELLSLFDNDKETVIEKINDLIQNYRILFYESNKEVLFKYQSEEDAHKFRDLQTEDIQIYELILSAGENGMTLNDLKIKTNISTNILNKYLKKLERKEIIKSLQMVNMKNKKVHFYP